MKCDEGWGYMQWRPGMNTGKRLNFEQRLVKVKAFEAENYLHFWKKSKAAKVARMKWAAQEEIGMRCERKRGSSLAQIVSHSKEFRFSWKNWWGCFGFLPHSGIGCCECFLSFKAIESKVDTNTTLSGSLCLTFQWIIWIYFSVLLFV